uniref:HD domain-containing protein n=1 Tax=Strigamia maritima TaxID=126957 RepID=T1IUT7_STRMM
MVSKQSPLIYKIFNDEVYGAIKLDERYFHIIDTKEFQRLRNIHHLGYSQPVYPRATHTRFEHSIGVCHLAETLAKQLQAQLETEELIFKNERITITDNEVACVAIAGLCHDLGYGPFSHVWKKYLKQEKNIKWKHKKIISTESFMNICNDPTIWKQLNLTENERDLIFDFINPASKDAPVDASENAPVDTPENAPVDTPKDTQH